jgi:hypothetical protein
MPLQGDLTEFSLSDIIQLVDLSKQTGGAHIAGELDGKKVEGWIFFRSGVVISARFGRLPPEEALYTLFTLPSGSFVFEENADLPPREINGSNEMLIMEGIRRVDEWTAIRDRTPPLDTVLGLAMNLTERRPEISLAPEEWRILTLVDGRNTIAEIADRSGLGEFRTCQVIVRLLDAQLVEKKEVHVGERLFEELGRIAVDNLGHSARVLLEDAFRRQKVDTKGDATPAQVDAICGGFERSISLLVGPSRAKRLVEDMRLRARQVFGESVWDAGLQK